MGQKIKATLFKIFDKTFGILFRAIQSTTTNRTESKGLHSLIHQKAVEDSANYAVKNFSVAIMFQRRQELWAYCLKRNTNLISGGIIAEFGVWKGESINFFAQKKPNAKVYGFDSFEGLEEDWYGFDQLKGSYSTNGKLPKCEEKVELFIGWFESTMPGFKKNKRAADRFIAPRCRHI